MPELGKYAGEVLTAYGASLLLLAGIIWLSWRRSRRIRAELERIESGGRDGTS